LGLSAAASSGRARIAGSLVLGTVQLGLPYGRNKLGPLMSTENAFALLDTAWAAGVRAFDTAESYGIAAERLAGWISRGKAADMAVVTKVPPPALRAGALAAVRAATARFRDVADVTVLSHGTVDDDGWSRLSEAAAACGSMAGVSVYTAEEVKASTARRGVTRVQAPGNVFDLRAITARSPANVPLDLRSVFLQGVLLEQPGDAEARAPGARGAVMAVRSAAADVGYPIVPLLIASVLSRCASGDRVVLGADTPDQIAEFAAAFEIPESAVRSFGDLVSASFEPTERLLDPRQW
jgi:aryl-alcohol dehydrogenase-like predicted oxidoreductase